MSRISRLGPLLLVGAMAFSTALTAQDKDKKEDKKDANRVTAEEIATRPEAKSAYDVAQFLRPAWLRACHSGAAGVTRETATAPVIYFDDMKVGELKERAPLSEIRAGDVAEMKFIPGSRAVAVYGDGHECGAIFVTRKKQ